MSSTPISTSLALLARAQAVIPAASQTLSKRPNQLAQGLAPVFLQRAKGCRVDDVDGNTYLDYSMALGAVVLGYQHPAVNEAIHRQLEDGVLFSLPHPLELQLAERLIDVIPCAEMVRFSKNGSDATAGAVRVARAYTGRDRVAVCGYHGSQDWFIGTTSWDVGVPASTKAMSHTFRYNDLDSLKTLLQQFPGEFAAVILEPVSLTPPAAGFLEGVLDAAHRHGALVIFDEILTGYRFRLGGAQGLFGVTPDLACFGKAMANGMPLAAVVGRRDVMRTFERVFFSYTFGGETLSLAAAMATLDAMMRQQVIEHMWTVGRQLQEGCRRLIEDAGLSSRLSCVGYPPRHAFRFCDEQGQESLALKTLFLQETVKRGILTMGTHNLSLAHTQDDVAWTLDVYRTVFHVLRQAVDEHRVEERLEVPIVEPVFRTV
jgi:glutamate-1-semialdehyde aminotransferase